jgi:hypothetical protein
VRQIVVSDGGYRLPRSIVCREPRVDATVEQRPVSSFPSGAPDPEA